jgi:hypothetical protein
MVTLLIAAACSHRLHEDQQAYAPTAEETAWIQERLLTIQKELPEFDRIDDNLYWKLAGCRGPYNDPYPVTYKDTIFNKDSLFQKQQVLRQSQSDDLETHGRALYRLFAKAKLEYAKAGRITQPDNQVIVKATYKPVAIESAPSHSEKQAALGADGKWYREGDPDDLYIMFRTDRKGIQTDAGWVYGIVSIDEDKVVAQGLLQNCMGCHRRNAPDRLFGLAE